MKKFIILIGLIFSFNLITSGQSCYNCPECNQFLYDAICFDQYDIGMDNNNESLNVGIELCDIDATDCLQNEGYNPQSTGCAPSMVINTPCEGQYNSCTDSMLNEFFDFMMEITEAFHDCAEAAGCGGTW